MKRSLASLSIPVAVLFLIAMAGWLTMGFRRSGPPSLWVQTATLAVAALAVIYLLALLASLRIKPQAARRTSREAEETAEAPSAHFHDRLTGLPGRLWLEQTLTSEIARSRRYHRHFSVIVIDIDHFSRLNRTEGRAAGDRVLEAVGGLLRSHVRQSDHLARLGDDEFVLVLAETPQKGALQLAEKLRGMVESFRLDNDLAVTVSLGVAAARDSDSVNELLDRGGAAAMTARRDGGNRVATATF